ncbi:MAG: GHKL domain-containing protein [Deltaproteobacteria bacterium]|nr:GHKL domain-containing protein [Deltaproteobacteria bacterium]
MKKSTNRFSQTYEPSVPLIKGNVHRIEQVVINLLANASQALTNSEQAVSVSTTYDHKSDCVVVEVQDEGVGMSADVLQQITDPFFTTKRDTAGTGLGLSMSDRIVTDHGGKMIFESVVGQGTAVKVYFPASTVSKEESRFGNERHS